MRGSPLVRFVILLIVLIGSGAWIARVTRAGLSPIPPAEAIAENPNQESTTRIPYRLVLSSAAEEIAVGTLGGECEQTSLRGQLTSDAADPVITLRVRWRDEGTEGLRHFAKLILEIPGRETLEHVFDAAGDIDDVWEIQAAEAQP